MIAPGIYVLTDMAGMKVFLKYSHPPTGSTFIHTHLLALHLFTKPLAL